MRIALIGASGVLGRQTVPLLLAQGHAVRAMTRSPQRAVALAASGCEPVIGDLIEPASLARACQGVDAVVAGAHSMLGRGRWRSEAVDGAGSRALIEAARAAGVRRFVYVSVCGAAPDHPVDFFRTKWSVEQAVRASGMAHVILRPTAFMEWHVHEFNGRAVLERGEIRTIGSGAKPRNFVAAADVAQFVVRALSDDALRGRALEIGGPANLTHHEVARLYASTAGIDPRERRLPAALARVAGAAIAPFHPGVGRILRLLGLPDDAFDERFDAAALQAEFGVTLTPVETFVRAQVALWRSGRSGRSGGG